MMDGWNNIVIADNDDDDELVAANDDDADDDKLDDESVFFGFIFLFCLCFVDAVDVDTEFK